MPLGLSAFRLAMSAASFWWNSRSKNRFTKAACDRGEMTFGNMGGFRDAPCNRPWLPMTKRLKMQVFEAGSRTRTVARGGGFLCRSGRSLLVCFNFSPHPSEESRGRENKSFKWSGKLMNERELFWSWWLPENLEKRHRCVSETWVEETGLHWPTIKWEGRVGVGIRRESRQFCHPISF